MLKKKHDKIINIMQLRFFCQVALRGSVSLSLIHISEPTRPY